MLNLQQLSCKFTWLWTDCTALQDAQTVAGWTFALQRLVWVDPGDTQKWMASWQQPHPFEEGTGSCWQGMLDARRWQRRCLHHEYWHHDLGTIRCHLQQPPSHAPQEWTAESAGLLQHHLEPSEMMMMMMQHGVTTKMMMMMMMNAEGGPASFRLRKQFSWQMFAQLMGALIAFSSLFAALSSLSSVFSRMRLRVPPPQGLSAPFSSCWCVFFCAVFFLLVLPFPRPGACFRTVSSEERSSSWSASSGPSTWSTTNGRRRMHFDVCFGWSPGTQSVAHMWCWGLQQTEWAPVLLAQHCRTFLLAEGPSSAVWSSPKLHLELSGG